MFVVIASIAAALVAVPTAGAAPVGLDSGFGASGTVLTPIGTPIGSGDARANSMALQADGKLVAAGYARDGRNDKFALARYHPDGSLDMTFGSNGTAMTQVGSADGSHDEIEAVAVQPDGKLVVAGYAAPSFEVFALARYNPDGSLDTTFNPHGTVVTGHPGTVLTSVGSPAVGRATSLAVQDDGKLVAGGFARDQAATRFALVRYQADGSLDTTFGSGGTVLTPVGSDGFAVVGALALQADGKLVAAGTSADGGHNRFALARYHPDGSLDTSFGAGGTVLTPVGSGDAILSSLAVDGAGRLVVAGSARDGQAGAFALARYDANGSLDRDFGSSGTVLTRVGSDGAAAAHALITDEGGLLAGGVASDGGVAKFALVRYHGNGSPDTGFNSTGAVVTPVGNGSFAASASLLLADGRPVAAGYANHEGANVFALARYRQLPESPAQAQPAPAPAPPAVCFQRLEVVICPGSTAASQQATGGPCRVQTRSATMTRTGRVKVRLRCPAAAKGTLRLRTSGRHRVGGKTRKKRMLGRRSFSLPRGMAKTFRVKLSKTGRRIVRKDRRLRARATLSARRGAATTARTTSRALTIKARKR